jgi:hypothetical protein
MRPTNERCSSQKSEHPATQRLRLPKIGDQRDKIMSSRNRNIPFPQESCGALYRSELSSDSIENGQAPTRCFTGTHQANELQKSRSHWRPEASRATLDLKVVLRAPAQSYTNWRCTITAEIRGECKAPECIRWAVSPDFRPIFIRRRTDFHLVGTGGGQVHVAINTLHQQSLMILDYNREMTVPCRTDHQAGISNAILAVDLRVCRQRKANQQYCSKNQNQE